MKKGVCFFGRSGAGKGKLPCLLSEEIGWPIISTGDLIREEARKDTITGRICREALEGGTFLTAQQILGLEYGAIQAYKDSPGIIFEGSPRSAGEAEFLFEHLELMVFWLDTPREVCMDRLLIRGRTDDVPEKIQRRHEEFDRIYPEVAKVVGLLRIDGTLEPGIKLEKVLAYMDKKTFVRTIPAGF